MTIRAELADGRVLEFPDGTDPGVIQATVKRMIAEAPAQQSDATKPQEGIGAALTGGFKRFLSTGETALESLVNPELAAQRGVERAQQIGQQYAPGASLDKVKQAYAERGFFPAVGEAISQIPSALAEQAPQIAATLGAAKAGAMAGAPLGPVGAVVGGLGGAAAPSLLQLYGANIERQAQEGAPEISRAAALAAAAPGAALEVASTFIPLGRNLVGKLLGPSAEKALARGSNEAIERAAQETLTASIAKGAGVGVLAEVPTEVTQQMLERLQAGLPLTTEDALKEYGEAAYGAGLVGGPFGAGARALGRPAARSEFERIQQEEADRLAVSEEELAQRFPDVLPGGFKINREELGTETVPQGFSIMAEGRDEPLSVVDTQEDADAKLEALTKIREQEREKILKDEEKINADVKKSRDRLEYLEATEQTGTDEYQSLKAELPNLMDESAQKIKDLYERSESLSKPLTVMPFGEMQRVNEQFNVVGPDQTPVGTFKTSGEAEAVVTQAVGEDVFKQTQQRREVAKDLYKTFVPQMRKFGLGDVGLNIVDRIENGAGGAYLNKLIRVSLEDTKPVQTMRHEALHAMKDLGFFKPQQWKALEDRANKQWIKELKEAKYDEKQSRYDAYVDLFTKEGEQKGFAGKELEQYVNEAVVEEAIADAFGAYDKGAKPPPGMIASLYKKIKDFFASLGQAFRGAGFQSADDIFQNIERGKLKPAASKEISAEKLSLPIMRGEEIPKFEGPLKEGEKEAKRLKPTVDLIGQYFDKQIKDRNGSKLDYTDKQSFDNAVKTATDEVKYQMEKEKSGLDWYEDDVKEAFKQTKKFIPELGKTDNRLLFSVIAGIMSPQTNARDNWFIAAKAFEHYLDTKTIPGNNPETGGLWQGGTQSPNKKIQLEFLDRMVKDMGQKKALGWLFQDHAVKEINEFRQKYGNIKSGIEGKLTDMKPGLYAFGPKVGPFVSNLNGIHDVTVDKWMTRTFNRYFGTMTGADGKIIDAPTEPQRRAVKALVNEVAKNAGIKPYQVQSLLWFYEQRLFTEIGVPSPSYGFSDGGRKYAESRGRGGEKGVSTVAETIARPVKGEKRETTRPTKPVERPGPRGELKRKDGEKFSLREDIRSYRGRDEKISKTHTKTSIGDGASVRVLGAKPIAQYTPIDQFKGIVGGYGFQSPVFYELSGKDAAVYEQAIQNAKNANPYGAAVYVYPVEEYADMRLFMTEDGKSGVALKGDDIVSVFSGPPHKGSANSSIQLAIQEGGRRLDAFDTVLTSLYHANGFKVVGRMKWNEDYKPDNWDKEKFSPFNNGEPDVVYMVYDPDDTRTIEENPGNYFEDPDELARVQKDAAKAYGSEGIVLGTKQPGAISVKAAHYGNARVSELDPAKYGTGLRGAERRRLEQAFDDRIKRRVYFYIRKEDGSTPPPEAGVGNHVYTQQFDNILGPGAEMSRLFREGNGDSNNFESNVIDAGYDGYAAPSMGMMVILNHKVPVNYVGPRSEVGVQKLSLKRVAFPTVKEAKEAVKNAVMPDNEAFKLYNAGNQWVDKDGKPRVFYHATAREFFEFTPAGQSQAIFLAETPEEAETFGSIAEDRLRREIYRALSKDEKLNFFQGVVNGAVEKKAITEKQGQDFMRQANRKVPDYGDFGDIEQAIYDALLDLSPTRMSIMPLYARAMTPFDFENKDHVAQVMNWVANNTQYPQDFPEKWLNGMKGRVSQGLWQAIEDKRVQQAIRALGFDAFTVRENRSSPKNYAVYKPQQVKSVTGNDGGFSLETKDVRYSLSRVRYTPERFEKLLSESAYSNDTTTKGYMAFVDPMDFVKATSTQQEFDRVKSEQEPLDFARMSGLADEPKMFVSKRGDEWKILDHEGRHRMLAMHDAGYRSVPVYIQFYSGIEDAKTIPVKAINGQTGAINSIVMVAEAEPLSYANKDRAMKKFTGMDSDVKYSMPTLSKDTVDRIKEVAPQRYQPKWKDRVIGAFKPDYTELRQRFLNRYETLANYDERNQAKIRAAGGPELLADQRAEFAALQSDLSAGVAASAMGIGDRQGGVPVYRNGLTTIDTSVKGLVEALAPLAKYDKPTGTEDADIYSKYQFWAGWKRGRRLLREGKEQLYTAADAKRAQEIENNHPEFVQVQKNLIAFNNGIVNYAVQTGVLSRERAQLYTKYSDYIPFYRQLDLDKTIGPDPFGGISGVKGPKKLKGGESPLGDFLENMVRNTQSMINAGMKNAAAQRATKVALEIKEVERLPRPASGFDVYTQLENGQVVHYRSSDPLFIEALKSLNMPDLPFMGLLSAPANVLRNLVTKDPGFMMANLLRDSLSSYVTSGQKITPIVGTMVNFGKALSSKNKNLQALFNAGIIGGYEFSQNIEQSGQSLSDDLNKKAGKDPILLRPFKSLWEGLEKGTTASDAATRMAVYERVMKETGNEAEAISRALEVMNFNRKGNSVLIRIATAALPFFNARLQGLDLFYRASTGQMNTQDAKEIQKRFWIRGMTMAALSVMYYLSVADDEEYEKQEEETKDNNWIFPSLGIRIPIPFEVGTLFKTMPERITAYLMGNDTGKELGQSTLRALANTFALNPIPQTFKPIIEAATNYNFFTMRPIVGQGMQEVEARFQVGPGTSKSAEYIGGLLNLSPLKVDQVIKGYTGTIGGYVTDVVDSITSQFSDAPKASLRFEQLPVVKRFVSDPEARGSVTQFYELQRSVDTVVRTMSLLEKTARPEEFAKYLEDNIGLLAVKDYVRDIEKSMKELREMRRTINSSPMEPDEKRDILIDLGRMESNLTANIGQVKKAISELK